MIEIRSKLDEATLKEANKVKNRPMILLFSLLGIVFIAIGVLFIFLDKEEYYLGVGVISAGAFLLIYCLILIFVQNQQFKTMSVISDQTIESYKFDEERILIETTKGDVFRCVTEADYSYLYQVKETEKFWFLYTSSTQMHIVPKSGLIDGSVEELNALFLKKIGLKFNRILKK